jgi:hypothetical protein
MFFKHAKSLYFLGRDDKDSTFLANFYLFLFYFFLKIKNKKVSEAIIYFFVLLFIGVFKKMKFPFFFIKMVIF